MLSGCRSDVESPGHARVSASLRCGRREARGLHPVRCSAGFGREMLMHLIAEDLLVSELVDLGVEWLSLRCFQVGWLAAVL